MNTPILEVKGLTVSFQDEGVSYDIVRDISFSLYPHKTLALVGESGCGKSVTAAALIGLFRSKLMKITTGQILFCGEDLVKKNEADLRHIRGTGIAFIQQNPLNSLNPTLTIGTQLLESIDPHMNKKAAKIEALEMLRKVGLSDCEKRFFSYPHELSGGMRQRVLIAMALINQPKVLIADEPTTALDVTIQAQILDLLQELQEKTGTSILFITHDMGVVARIASQVAIMYAGKIVEMGGANDIFYTPEHPYTQALLSAINLAAANSPLLGAPPHIGQFQGMCSFLPRCPFAMSLCSKKEPDAVICKETHQVSCWKISR